METSAAPVYMLFISGCLLFVKPLKELISSNYGKLLLALLTCAWLIPIFSGSVDERLQPHLTVTNTIMFLLFLPVSYTYIRRQLHKSEDNPTYLRAVLPLALVSLVCILLYALRAYVFSDPGVTGWYALPLLFAAGLHLYYVLRALNSQSWRALKTASTFAGIKNRLGMLRLFRIKKHRARASHHVSVNMSRARMVELEGIVRKHLEEKRPFLQLGYSLRTFSDETHVPLHVLSAFINTYYKMNFNDFINEYRVLYSIDKLLKKEWKYKKLETIAEESGFNNRNTFTSAFKKVMGINPSEFLRDIKLGKLQQALVASDKFSTLMGAADK